MKNRYSSYLKYKKIIELFGKNDYTVTGSVKKTKLSKLMVYRIVNSLLENNVIVVSKTKSKTKYYRPPIIFKLKRGKLK